jgi:hypothetical protein
MNRFRNFNKLIKKEKVGIKTPEEKLLEFIEGVVKPASYESWCSNNGFLSCRNKTIRELNKEYEFIKNSQIRLELSLQNKVKRQTFKDKILEYMEDPLKSKDDFFAKTMTTIESQYICSHKWKDLSSNIFDKEYIDPITKVKIVESKTATVGTVISKKARNYFLSWLLDHSILEYIFYKNPGLVFLIFVFRNFLNNDLKKFKIKSKNYIKNELSLIKYCFVIYKVPTKFYEIFTNSTSYLNTYGGYSRNSDNYIYWGLPLFFDITRGVAFHRQWDKYKMLSCLIPLTNKEVWHFSNTVTGLEFEDLGELFVYAKLANLNINIKLIKRLMHLSNHLVLEEYRYKGGLEQSYIDRQKQFLDFVVFLNNNLENYNIDESVNLWDYVSRFVMIDPGTDYVSYKPNYFKHLTINTLFDRMVEWHDESNVDLQKKDLSWVKDSTINDYEEKIMARVVIDGKDAQMLSHTLNLFELTTYKDLKNEGDKMKHCVASYASNCAQGKCKIFSIKKNDMVIAGDKHTATIEVVNRRIVQIKGKRNQSVDQSTISFIKRWAEKNNLTLKDIYI